MKRLSPCAHDHRFVTLILLCVCLVGLSGCPGRKAKDDMPPLGPATAVGVDSQDSSADGGEQGDDGQMAEPIRRPTESLPDLSTIHFDFDSAELRDDEQELLDMNAAWLLAHPEVTVQVEGHCDERGTREYNFGLGLRRANSVIQYLKLKGVSPSRLYPISFGEDRPAIQGSGEEVWWQNRRVEFKRFVESD